LGKHTRLKKLAKRLLATTCLTAMAAGIAGAQTVNEAADFGDTLGTAFQLPMGTRNVNGLVDTQSDFFDGDDYMRFSGLAGGSLFSFTATTPLLRSVEVDLFSSAGVALPGSAFQFSSTAQESGLAMGSGIVPLDGILVFDFRVTGEASLRTPYSLHLNATDAAAAAPEPGTMGAMGLGIAGLGAMVRRRRKR
jgi:hypothetical protein